MVPKVRKETPVPPKAEAKANTLKAKRTVLKGVFSHAKKDPHLTYLLTAQDTAAWRQPKYPSKSTPRRNKLDHYTTVKFSLTTKSALKKTEDDTLCSLWVSRPTSTRSTRLWRSSVTLTWPRSHTDQAWWREEGICSTGSWLLCFGCCQQMGSSQLSPAA